MFLSLLRVFFIRLNAWRGNSVPPVQASWELLGCSFENVAATGFKKEKYVDGGDLVFFSL
jgi:hypothetical protein